MSVLLKLKARNTSAGSTISGKPSANEWVNRGPFGASAGAPTSFGGAGFSINGGYRNKGSVGGINTSTTGTPFKGIHPKGNGGRRGRYARPPPVMNVGVSRSQTSGTQGKYIKPSSLSTRGMLRQKYKYLYSGTYPNYWVQPNYTGSLTDNKSQSAYIRTRAIDNMRVVDPNFAYIQSGGGGKLSAQQVMAQKQFRCINQTSVQKPFPFATNGNACNGGRYYLTPPPWYLAMRTA